MNAAGSWKDRLRQRVGVRRFELGHGSIIENALDDFVLRRKGRQRLLIRRILAGFRLFRFVRNLQSVEQDFSQLLG